ncbi:MAG: hypothetical protein ABSH28_23455 [Acidobacteriota bacterium]
MNPLKLYQQFVFSTEDLVSLMKARGGCRYIVLEISKEATEIPAARLLHQAVQGPQFELMRSFPISGQGPDRIDVYRFKPELSPVDEVDFVFPALGDAARFKVHPIQR